MEIDPDNSVINKSAEEMAYQYSTDLKLPERAISLYKKILRIKGESYKAKYFWNLALMSAAMKNWAKARTEAEEAFKINNDKELYEGLLADFANQEGTSYAVNEMNNEAELKFEEALRLYESILLRNQDNIDCWNCKGLGMHINLL